MNNVSRQNPITKLIGGGIGIAREYSAHRKETKAAKSTESRDVADADAPLPYKAEEADDDEYNWELDDRQRSEEKLNRSSSNDALAGTDGVDVDKILAAFFEKHPPSPVESPEHVSG
jgi:hypothetical protein